MAGDSLHRALSVGANLFDKSEDVHKELWKIADKFHDRPTWRKVDHLRQLAEEGVNKRPVRGLQGVPGPLDRLLSQVEASRRNLDEAMNEEATASTALCRRVDEQQKDQTDKRRERAVELREERQQIEARAVERIRKVFQERNQPVPPEVWTELRVDMK